MTAAIYYHPEGYTTSGPKLMGRNSAGESFLRGYFQHSQASEFWAQVEDSTHVEQFSQTAKRFGREEPVKGFLSKNLHVLQKPGAIFYPGPGIADAARQRALFGHGLWSACGITYTISSSGAMDSIVDMITAPVEPWDALICISHDGKKAVEQMLQAQVDYLQHRLGISRIVLPQLPVIPLGLHTKDFDFTEGAKMQARAALGIAPDEIVVGFMGRLSFHAKAHPLAMYQALELAAKRTGKNVVMLECSWFANEFIKSAYEEAFAMAAPSVRSLVLNGRDDELRARAWAAADISCSLSDNIQETFGLAPVEAMAAGLPVVVSDWDGYKDTVRDGIDGFRVPTVMPQSDMGSDLAKRHAVGEDTFDLYSGHTCSLVAVDVGATANAFTELFRSKELRLKMGAAARERAQSIFDWSAIIPQYEQLWAELAERRRVDSSSLKTLRHPWPARMDPFASFECYPTHTLTLETRLKLALPVDEAVAKFKGFSSLKMVEFASAILPTNEEVEAVLLAAVGSDVDNAEGLTASELVSGIAPDRQAQVFRGLAWLIKLDVLSLALSPS